MNKSIPVAEWYRVEPQQISDWASDWPRFLLIMDISLMRLPDHEKYTR